MQKNKIDVVKAVCNSVTKTLAVLGLAVAVSGGAVASAQTSEENAKRHLQRIQLIGQPNEEAPQDRLRRLEREREEVRQQLEKVGAELYGYLKPIEEKQQQAKEKYNQTLKMQAQEKECLMKDSFVSGGSGALYTEALILRNDAWASILRINPLMLQERALASQFEELTAKIAALRAQIAREQQEEPVAEIVEEIVEIVPEDDEMKEEAEEQRENQNATTEANIPKDAFQKMLRLHLPNQRQGARGGMFKMMRPFGSKK